MDSKSEKRRKLKENRELQNLCVYCGINPPKASTTKGCSDCLSYKYKIQKKSSSKNIDKKKLYTRKIRQDAITKYGGKCNCCGETELLFLTIDHINNDGKFERKSRNGFNNGSSTAFYLKLKRLELRDDLQVLCFNCNMGKSAAFDKICPHHNPTRGIISMGEDRRHVSHFDINTKIEWPSIEVLSEMIKNNGVNATATALDVSVSTIYNRFKRRGIKIPSKLKLDHNNRRMRDDENWIVKQATI